MTVFKNLLTITSQRTAQNQHMKFTLLGPARNLKSHKYNIGRKIICQIKMLFIFQSKLICKHDFKKIRFFFNFQEQLRLICFYYLNLKKYVNLLQPHVHNVTKNYGIHVCNSHLCLGTSQHRHENNITN